MVQLADRIEQLPSTRDDHANLKLTKRRVEFRRVSDSLHNKLEFSSRNSTYF